ncbi:MAG: NADPH-dependent FMN reductase [Crocinitomicaceae bacterium]|nr:NADPH-dependent FMN reductase [Crocinitomicaceae bacterium]
MITLICGTNRPENVTSAVVKAYSELLKKRNIDHHILHLEHLPKDFVFNNDVIGNRNPDFSRIVKEAIDGADKLVFIAPEYNGGFPGVLKAFIDGIWPEVLKDKKVAFVGVASGRAGNLRGMDQLTNICHYLNMHVLPFKVPISSIEKFIDKNGAMTEENTLNVLDKQIGLFEKF